MGCAHEDIDEIYERLPTQIKWKDLFFLPKMMNTYRTCEDQNSFIPYLIDDLFNLKRFMDPHLLENKYNIICIKGCQYFKF